MFITEVMVKDVVVLDYIIFRYIFNILVYLNNNIMVSLRYKAGAEKWKHLI